MRRSIFTRHGRTDERGLTLVELLVAVALLSVIGTISVAAFMSGNRTFGFTDDDVRGQADLRIVTDRLARDLREARGINVGATASALTIWTDLDADYKKEIGEIITWEVVPGSGGTSHFDVKRSVDDGTSVVVGRAVIDAFAFSYADPDTPSAYLDLTLAADNAKIPRVNTVTVAMTYDAIIGAYLGAKETTYKIRLRNVQ